VRGGRGDRPLTQEVVGELLALGVSSGIARELAGLGVRTVEDLAGRDPLALFVAQTDRSARTHRNAYDAFVRAVRLAGGAPVVEDDPLAAVWRHRHGEGVPLPAPFGRLRLRCPTIGASSPVVTAVVDRRGHVTAPLGQHEVAVLADPSPRVAIGHWMWRGGLGAFARLEDLRVGDGVQLGDWYVVTDVELVAGDEPPVLPPPDGDELLLATPPHRRAGIIGMPEDLPPVERGVLQARVRALVSERSAVDADPRRKRPIRGAF
jgi:hypothetical protein